MKKSNIKINYFYNLLTQLLNIFIPLITSPYLAKTIGAAGIGRYSYTQSLVTLFISFGVMGASSFFAREIAYRRDSKKECSILFWEAVLLKNFTLFFSVLVYGLIIFVQPKVYHALLIIQVIDFFAELIDINWFYTAKEKFKNIFFCNLFIKLISIILLFECVKSIHDLEIYAIIVSACNLIGKLVLWKGINKSLLKIHFDELKPLKHFKEVFIVFLPQIATLIYTILDKIMLGVISHSDVENGYYAQGQNIVKMLLTVITSLSAVLMPRMANLFIKDNEEQIKLYLLNALKFVWLIATPMMMGIILLSKTFVIWFLGIQFEKVALLLCISAPLTLIIGLSSVINTAYLFPANRQKLITCILFLGSGINFLLNLVMIPKWQSIGATIATVCSEAIITIIMTVFLTRMIRIKVLIEISLKYVFSSVVMFIVLYQTCNFVEYTLLNILLIVIKGVIFYFLTLFVLREEYVVNLVDEIKKRLSKY